MYLYQKLSLVKTHSLVLISISVDVDINPPSPPLVQFHYPLYFSAGKMKIVFLPTYQHGNLLATQLRVDFRMREIKFA